MSKFEKAVMRLKSIPKDYTYDELRYVLEHLGFEEHNKGKTSGSSVSFFRASDKKVFMFHKPHPGNIVKPVYIKQVCELLEESGEV